MTTNVEIASQALLLLRANTISSFADDTNEAEIVNTMYTQHVKSLLSLHRWSFATKKRQLNQDTEAPINEFKYAHIVPSEALLIWSLTNTTDIGAPHIKEFRLYGTDSSRRIFSNQASLYADYTRYVDEATWPAYFVEFVVYSFASHIALPVTGNSSLSNTYSEKAYGSLSANRKGGLYGVAVSIDSRQQPGIRIESSPLIEARFS